jgi:group I intron endonuclease
MIGIYKIISPSNKVYIGQTVDINRRLYRDYKCSISQPKLYNSIKKYGPENFIIDLIIECDVSIIYETEKKYINEYDSYHNGMNSTFGGEGCLGYTHSPEIKQKISENTKNGNSHKGKTYEELYGERAEEEKLKRKMSSVWDKMTEEQRGVRVSNIKKASRKNAKYSIDLVKEIKQNSPHTKIELVLDSVYQSWLDLTRFDNVEHCITCCLLNFYFFIYK